MYIPDCKEEILLDPIMGQWEDNFLSSIKLSLLFKLLTKGNGDHLGSHFVFYMEVLVMFFPQCVESLCEDHLKDNYYEQGISHIR